MRGVRAARRNPERSRGNSVRTAIVISARRASLSLRLHLLRLIFLIPRMRLINRVLGRRLIQADVVLLVILLEVLVTAGSVAFLVFHLYPQFNLRQAF